MSLQEPITLQRFSLRRGLPTKASDSSVLEPGGPLTEVPWLPQGQSLQVLTDALPRGELGVSSLLLCSPHPQQLRHCPSSLLQTVLASSNMNSRQTREDRRQIYSSLVLSAAGTFTDQQAPSRSTRASHQLRSEALGSPLPSSPLSPLSTVHCDTASQFRVGVTLAVWRERRAPCMVLRGRLA